MRYCCKCHYCVNLSKEWGGRRGGGEGGVADARGFANEGRRRPEDNKKLKEEITERMGEGFRNEERTRKLVQNDSAVMKEEIKNLKMGSGSTVCSETSAAVCGSGTFARPPPLTSRCYEILQDAQ